MSFTKCNWDKIWMPVTIIGTGRISLYKLQRNTRIIHFTVPRSLCELQKKFFKMPYTCLILNLWTLEHHKTLGIVCSKIVIFFLNYTMEELLNNEQTSKLNTYFVGKITVYKLKNRHALFLQDIFTSDIWM